jgi:class 3 adenylate cyclase
MDLGGWLRRLGLERYEAAFREDEIDDTVLPSLTAEDLKDLGVALVGHRCKLLDAIAALRADASASAPVSAAPEAIDKATERRQLTVMFSDLVGSTSLSARMDPEDLREIISAYQTCVAGVVRRLGGSSRSTWATACSFISGIRKHMRTTPSEPCAQHWKRLLAVGALNLSLPLQTHIGIATGLVVIGDLIGSGEAQERGIVGETPNLAARLQSMAEPKAVVIAQST